MIARLSPSYAHARAAFLDAAAGADARVESWAHPLRGLDDEELFVDVAEVGPVDAANVIMVVSGTHGVEGYLGSAIQREHLGTLDPADTADVTIVFVHALNPFGFSWVRRVNEDNVDLNRNFIDWTGPPPRNDEYPDLAELLVPDSWSEDTQKRTLAALMSTLRELGLDRAQQIISGGQFDDPTGLFYGGTGPTWSHRWLRGFLQRRLERVRRAAILDLHTGLGPWGHAELISSDRPTTAAFQRQQDWWTDVTSLHDESSVATQVSGEWLGAAPGFAPKTEITGVAIEYGTVDSITVLQSLRADAVLHTTRNPRSPDAEAIRKQVRAAFVDDDPAWLEKCWSQYEPAVVAATQRLT